jgi:glycine hydroxymethyltransferase
LDASGWIDYDQVSYLARQHRPKLIICGTTSYTRTVDFRRFRAVADEVGAFLLADMTHIAGLVAAGLHPSPIDDAHFTTTCTHKQLYGPRGGLILIGRDAETLIPGTKHTLASMVQNAVFPFFQGTPAPNIMAAKARALARIVTPQFRSLAGRIVADAKALAEALIQAGHSVVSGGTDNHIVLMDVSQQCLSGIVAQQALENCSIIVNKNKIPGDKKAATVTSGIRLGTNSLACREMGPEEMKECAYLLDRVLRSTDPLSDSEYRLDKRVSKSIQSAVTELCQRFPLPYVSFAHATEVLKAAAGTGEFLESHGLEEYRG